MLLLSVSDVEGADTYPSAEPYNFLHGVEIIECPQLTKVEIKYCPELKTKIGKCPNLTDIRLYTFDA